MLTLSVGLAYLKFKRKKENIFNESYTKILQLVLLPWCAAVLVHPGDGLCDSVCVGLCRVLHQVWRPGLGDAFLADILGHLCVPAGVYCRVLCVPYGARRDEVLEFCGSAAHC